MYTHVDTCFALPYFKHIFDGAMVWPLALRSSVLGKAATQLAGTVRWAAAELGLSDVHLAVPPTLRQDHAQVHHVYTHV